MWMLVCMGFLWVCVCFVWMCVCISVCVFCNLLSIVMLGVCSDPLSDWHTPSSDRSKKSFLTHTHTHPHTHLHTHPQTYTHKLKHPPTHKHTHKHTHTNTHRSNKNIFIFALRSNNGKVLSFATRPKTIAELLGPNEYLPSVDAA